MEPDRIRLRHLLDETLEFQDGRLGIRSGVGLGGGGGLSPYTATPTSPSAWDLDAAVLQDPDLAAAGWEVRERAGGFAILTRAGEVVFGSPPAAGTYRSTLAGGKLIIQLPTDSGCTITKGVSDVSATYRARITSSDPGNTHFAWLTVGSGLAIHATGDYIVTGVEWGTYVSNRILGESFDPHAQALPFGRMDVVNYIHYTAGGATVSESYTAHSGIRGLSPFSRTIAPITRAGVMIHSQVGEPNTLFILDHIRALPHLARF